jgi:hypothetical protein
MNVGMIIPQPKPWRLLLGFLMAPIAPATLLALWPVLLGTEQPDVAAIARTMFAVLVYGGIPAVLVLGVPLYLALRRRLYPRLATIVAAGGLIAVLPWLVLVMWSAQVASYAEVDSCVSVIDGVRTWCGYLEVMKFLAMIFGLGAVGGLTFWLCVVWRDPRYASATAPG